MEWVRGTLPWPNAQQDQSRLFHLPPPTIGPPSEEKRPPKDTPPPSTLEADPLVSDVSVVKVKMSVFVRPLTRALPVSPCDQMAMLLKLQESANCIESPEREGGLDHSLQAIL